MKLWSMALGAIVTIGSGSVSEARAQQTIARGPTHTATVLDRAVTVSFSGISLREAIGAIAQKGSVRLQYRDQVLHGKEGKVSLQAQEMALREAFSIVLAGTDLRVVPVGSNAVTIEPVAVVAAQDGVIVGKVLNGKTQQPVAGATVTVEGTSVRATSAQDGTFRLAISEGEKRVRVRVVGFSPAIQVAHVSAGMTTNVEVVLAPTTNVLSEVIVTGTVVETERKAISTPITVITAEEIEKRGITRIEQLFRGEVPGLISLETGTQSYGGVNGTVFGQMERSSLFSRGASTLTASSNPLDSYSTNPIKTFIDGVEMLDPQYLGMLDPKSIDRIEIVTGPQAATIYGSGAMAGVMQIFTKKGVGSSSPEIQLTGIVGILQNNLSRGRTPTHNHSLAVNGSAGSTLSYSANASYGYTGQWQPGLYSRRLGFSIGAVLTQNALTASGSISTTGSQNGTSNFAGSLNNGVGSILQQKMIESGEWATGSRSTISSFLTKRVSKSAGLTLAGSIEYRPMQSWQHRATFGKNQSVFDVADGVPTFITPPDTLYHHSKFVGERNSASYNTTWLSPSIHRSNISMTYGVTGSWGSSAQMRWSKAMQSISRIGESFSLPGSSANNWGFFGSWRIALYDHLYINMGVRGEKSNTYGRDHKIDWTPTNGLSYVFDIGSLSVKLLGSYGRSTRLPTEKMQEEIFRFVENFDPSYNQEQFSAPLLRPEYSRGPQFGFELYSGNRGSITINRYTQTVTDLIQRLIFNRFMVYRKLQDDSLLVSQYKYINTSSIRQEGWESTMSLNFGRISMKGTYSWNDSRILYVNRDDIPTGEGAYYPSGSSFYNIPTHSGNFTLGYMASRTSLTLVTNYIGSSLQYGRARLLGVQTSNFRIRSYRDRYRDTDIEWTSKGYVKSDLAISHMASRDLSFTTNVTNLWNRFDSDVGELWPSLGRQTKVGMSWRWR